MDDFDYINSLEKQLSESLQPIRPDPTFIKSLKEKLSNSSSVYVENRSPRPGLLIIGLGLFTGVLMIWLLRRFRS
jgi:hypothetical protein